MFLPQLIKTDSFCYLKEIPSSPNGKSILFLHGLGESRSGINYLFKELSMGLMDRGYSVYRFDLGGCGDSPLPLSLSVWKKQLYFLLDSFSIVIARGLSSILLPLEGKKSISLRPFSKEHFMRTYPLIPALTIDGKWIPDVHHSVTEKEEMFWFNLGVEASCFGGLSLPLEMIKEIEMFPAKSGSIVLDPPDCHPLFLFQKDRQLLLEKLVEIL